MAKGIILKDLESGTNYRVSFPCVIGRSRESDIPLTDASVSQRHAVLEEADDDMWVRDLNSLNGVYVNGGKIVAKSLLKLNDTLQLGQTRLLVVREPQEHVGEQTVVLRSVGLQSTLQLDRQRLKSLYEITSDLAEKTDLNKLGETVFSRLKGIFQQDRGHLALFQEDGLLKTIFSIPSASVVPLSRSITKRLFQNGESFLLQDALGESSLNLQESVLALKIRSAICVPLVHRNQIYGLIYLDREVPGAYTQADLEFLRAVGSILAPLIENARLWSKLNQSYANAMETLRETQARLINAERTAAYVRLAQAMAHEIRNPLTVIGGLFRRLAKSESMGTEDARIKMIMNALERIETVLREVDDFVGLPPVQRRLHKIDSLVEEAIASHREEWRQKNLTFDLSIDTSNLMIPLDDQLFVKAISMIVEDIFREVPQDSTIKINVRDSGNDIEIAFGETAAVHSFCEAFDPKLRSKPWSLGLFINVAHKIVKDHGGKLLLNPEGSCAFPVIVRVPRITDGQTDPADA